jgi:3-hydroxybutyryl-CoA dehydrogenase
MKIEEVNHVAIIGTGMIGASLAALFTGNGYRTTMMALDEQDGINGLTRYRTTFEDLIRSGLVKAWQAKACEELLSVEESYETIADADFVYECVIEDYDVKKSVYRKLENHCTRLKGISSSSSAMDTNYLSTAFSNPEFKKLFAAAHPWNPPHLVPCVEIVKGDDTSDEALSFICCLLESCGRAPVVMNKSVPGFIANRLQHALYREAANMVERGIASPEDIDRALMTSFAPRYSSIGIFQHYDYVGLDMILSIQKVLYPDLAATSDPDSLVVEAYERGDLGYKTGKGVLDWEGVDIDLYREKAASPYLKFFNWSLPEES